MPARAVSAFSGSMPEAMAKLAYRDSQRARSPSPFGMLKCATTKGDPGLRRRLTSAAVRRRSSKGKKCIVRRQVAPSNGPGGASSIVPSVNVTREAKGPSTCLASWSIAADGSTPRNVQFECASANIFSSSPPPAPTTSTLPADPTRSARRSVVMRCIPTYPGTIRGGPSV